MEYAELELGLSRRNGDSCLDLRFSQPGSDADIRLVRDGGQIQRVAGQIVYTLDVAIDAAVAGCGAPGWLVTIVLDGRITVVGVPWNHQQAREVYLGTP